jgi:lipoprotein signal peptidase
MAARNLVARMSSGWAVAWLVSADAATKGLAYLFLPHGAAVRVGAVFQLVLEVNRGLGAYMQAYGEKAAAAQTIPNAFAYAGLALALLGVRRRKVGTLRAVLICVVSMGAAYVAGMLLSPHFHAVGFVGRERFQALTRALLVLVIWRQVKPGPWKAAVGLWLAGVLGNTVSLFVPPFAAIDFLYSRPVDAVLGLGVFNVADVYQVAAVGFLVVLLIRAAGRRLAASRNRSA